MADDEPLPFTFPVALTGICIDCDRVFDLRHRHCPRCGGVVFLPLSRIFVPRETPA